MPETTFEELESGNQLLITRAFSAPLKLVWRAWTEAELLDRWWAPKPWNCITKTMDFREGGQWFYCMAGPDGENLWAITSFLKIVNQTYFEAADRFCDEEQNLVPEMPQSNWQASFNRTDTGTQVKLTYTFDSQATMQEWLAMGAEEGYRLSFGEMDEVLKGLQSNT